MLNRARHVGRMAKACWFSILPFNVYMNLTVATPSHIHNFTKCISLQRHVFHQIQIAIVHRCHQGENNQRHLTVSEYCIITSLTVLKHLLDSSSPAVIAVSLSQTNFVTMPKKNALIYFRNLSNKNEC